MTSFDVRCEACCHCQSCDRAFCRDEQPSPREDELICATCAEAMEAVS